MSTGAPLPRQQQRRHWTPRSAWRPSEQRLAFACPPTAVKDARRKSFRPLLVSQTGMDPFRRRPIGATSLKLTQLGLGGASLGDMRETIAEAQASAAIEAAHAAGIGYFDTSPW